MFGLTTVFFWPVIFGGQTLLPADNLFTFEPWRSFADEFDISVPHNELLNDLILENYAWKLFTVQSIKARQIPLWNPHIFAGLPFLAAGQHSALYPFSVLFYVLPIARAYGYFTVLQLFLASLFAFIYARIIGLGRLGAAVTAITYMFSAFMVVSVVFTMIIAAAAWLPLLLAMIELIVKKVGENRGDASPPLLYVVFGAVALGFQLLAGHIEISYYVLLVMAFYAAIRLWQLARVGKSAAGRALFWLMVMVVLGLALGAVQLIPLYELVSRSFRQSSASYQQVVGWAYPLRRLIAFLVPDFFGNPSHHSYLDVFGRQAVTVTRDYYGNPISNIYWGIKNYVEGGSYLGILPLLLALVAIFRRRNKYTWIFAGLAAISLAFVFGTPLYALLFYLLPGIKQLHSPFRWIFPYTLSVAVLAGIGAHHCEAQSSKFKVQSSKFEVQSSKFKFEIGHKLGWIALLAGLGLVAALALSLFFPDVVIPLAERVMLSLAKAPEAFADGQMFYSYEFRNLLIFGLFLASSGAVLLLARSSLRLGRYKVWKPLALLVLIGDVFVFGHGFNPAADPKLLDFKPPVVEFLQQDKSLYRITTYNAPDEKTFNANVGMFYGLSDARGYDSIIPRQYTDYMGLIYPQTELQYNRIAPIYTDHRQALDSPLLDLLNVKYVLTTQEIENPRYTLVYDEEVRVYRNEGCLPRAFSLPASCAIVTDDVAEALRTYDPRQYVILEPQAANLQYPISNIQPQTCNLQPATVTSYTPNEVFIDVELEQPSFLVLADSYFPGWKAFRRPQGAGEGEEQELEIYRADGNFRAVSLPAGRWTVRFKYSPMSFKLGLFVSFMAGLMLVLLLGYWLWGRFYRKSIEDSDARRVAKNSLAPIVLQLVNKAIETAFAALMLRFLGPDAAGKYYFAVIIWIWLDIFTTFGLNILLQREVAKNRALANRYLANTTILRLILIAIAVPLLAVFIGARQLTRPLAGDTITAIVLLAVGLLPGSLANGFTAVFNAFEKMEYPAAVTTVTTVLKVVLGTLVLLRGLGFVGLAGLSIAINVVTAAILLYLLIRTRLLLRGVPAPRAFELDFALQRRMVGLSWPLMLNNLISFSFFKIDVFLLEAMQGSTVVGLYSVAYKFLDALNILPASFTIAVFPIMSRYADSAKDSLMKAYLLSVRLLIIIALPIAIATTALAEPLVYLLGGSQYLPHSRIALQLMIWSIPIGFINSVTYYVLIALNQQRFLTKAFAIGLAFTVVANVVFIPVYSYRASALIHLFSELALLLPFYYCLRKHLAPVPWGRLLWRPALAAALMAGLLWLLHDTSFLITVPLGGLLYLLALILLGTFSEEEVALFKSLLSFGPWKVELEAQSSKLKAQSSNKKDRGLPCGR
ncbi:MAG: oligosaccharide flippase family protein [Anaerolineae bacterium]